jgi:hypothetical protein
MAILSHEANPRLWRWRFFAEPLMEKFRRLVASQVAPFQQAAQLVQIGIHDGEGRQGFLQGWQ